MPVHTQHLCTCYARILASRHVCQTRIGKARLLRGRCTDWGAVYLPATLHWSSNDTRGSGLCNGPTILPFVHNAAD